MEFTVSKADLVRELGLSQGVVEKKTTIPILSNVLLEAKGDRIVLTATDLELGIRCSCPARIKKEGAGTIPARKLLDYDLSQNLGGWQWAAPAAVEHVDGRRVAPFSGDAASRLWD